MAREILDLRRVDESTLEKLNQMGIKHIFNCIQCGTCSASCPSGRLTAFRVRQLIRRTLLGLDKVLKDDNLWLCTTCYTCLERCPQKIETVPIIIALRNLAVEKGCMIPRHKEVAHMFIRYGHAVPINDENAAKRESLGLTRFPPTVHSFTQSLEELQKLVRKTGFDRKVGFKWEETR